MEAHLWAVEVYLGAVEVYHGAVEPHPGALEADPGSMEAHTRNFAKLKPFRMNFDFREISKATFVNTLPPAHIFKRLWSQGTIPRNEFCQPM
jgi:hypothetical protein